MAKCRVCGKEAEFKIKNYNLVICRECFLNRLYRRIEETIRKYRMFGRDEAIYVPVQGYNALEVAEILGEMGYRIQVVGENEPIPQGGVVAFGNLLEDEVANVILGILNWELKDDIFPVFQKGGARFVKPLCLITEEEMDIFREIKGIEKRKGEENIIKRKMKERKLLSIGFWLSFFKSFLREHALLFEEGTRDS